MRGLWIVFSFAPMATSGDRWLAPDKIQHFLTSAFVQSMTYGSLRATGAGHRSAIIGASAVTAAVGIGKEYHDRNTRDDFSYKDLVWDAAGAGAVSVLLNKTRR